MSNIGEFPVESNSKKTEDEVDPVGPKIVHELAACAEAKLHWYVCGGKPPLTLDESSNVKGSSQLTSIKFMSTSKSLGQHSTEGVAQTY
jgi:hypothetical protein